MEHKGTNHNHTNNTSLVANNRSLHIIYVIAIVGVFAFEIREQKFIAEKRILEEKVNERTYEIMMQMKNSKTVTE